MKREEETKTESAASALPAVPAAAVGPASETAEERRRPLLVRLRELLPAWLLYTVPLPTWNTLAAAFAAVLRQWRWLAPLLAAEGALAWLYFHGSTLDGTVRYHGKPVERGRVVLAPADNPDAPPTVRLTARIENGKYQADGA